MNLLHGISQTLWGIAIGALLLGSASWAAQEAPATLQPGQSCTTADCHGDVVDMEVLHGPVNMQQCQPCHIQVDNKHLFESAAQGRELCLVCHEVEPEKDVVHPPFEQECILCHDPHGGESRNFTKGGEGAESCKLCHGDVTEGLAYIHGPLALGECVACHSPHQSDHEGLLTEAPSDLCQSCHVDMEQRLAGAVSIHQPVQESCSQCHGAHGGKTRFFLETTGLEHCRSCHGDFLEDMAGFEFTHQPMVEGKACENCHVAHASNQDYLLQVDTGELCLSCHNQPIQTEAGATIDNVASQIEGAEFLHGPVRENNCSACHRAHGSDFDSILNKPFPADFYTAYEPEKYDLCFECHDATIIQSENTTATGFRNGSQNLHFLHVNREKGRSCRACHHEHASNQSNHIRSEVPFGKWTMTVDFTKFEAGGTCMTGCHMPFEYNREDPVENQVGAPQ